MLGGATVLEKHLSQSNWVMAVGEISKPCLLSNTFTLQLRIALWTAKDICYGDATAALEKRLSHSRLGAGGPFTERIDKQTHCAPTLLLQSVLEWTNEPAVKQYFLVLERARMAQQWFVRADWHRGARWVLARRRPLLQKSSISGLIPPHEVFFLFVFLTL